MRANLGRDYREPRDSANEERTAEQRADDRAAFQRAWRDANARLNPTVQEQHLAVVAFLAVMVRIAGVVITSADQLYVAGYMAKAEQLGRLPQPHERERLRRAADRIWSALTLVPLAQGGREVSHG